MYMCRLYIPFHSFLGEVQTKLGKTAEIFMCHRVSACCLLEHLPLITQVNYVSLTIFAGLQAYTKDMYRYTKGNRSISK